MDVVYQIAAYLNIISLVIGILLGMLLIFLKRANQKANRFLGIVPLILVFWQCWVLATTNTAFLYYDFLDWIPFSNLLALGPSLYFYAKKSTHPSIRLNIKDLIHFIPLGIEWLVYFKFRPQGALESFQTYTWASPRFFIQVIAVLSIGGYSYAALRSIRKQYREKKLIPERNLKMPTCFILVFAVLWFLWIPYALINTFFFNYYISDYDFYPLHTAIWLVTLWMGSKMLLQPEVVLVQKNLKKEKSKKTPSKQLLEQAHWLNEKMKSDAYYLNPDLTLQSLAKDLNIHANTISQIINEGLDKGFSDFVNEHRIHSVIKKLNDPNYSHITVLGMAYESGFNSKTTFNRAFKKLTGKTPMAFKQHLHKP